MPVVVASASRSANALISYALDDKAEQKGERYVMASGTGGLLVSVAKEQMRDIRKKWGKDRPGAFVQAYHVIQSYAKDELDPDEPDSWMTAQDLGRALTEDRFPGRQTLIVTQRDGKTGCVHNHLIINSIETRTGRSLDSSIVMHARLVEAHERVLEAEGFEQRADLKMAFSNASERWERGEPSGLRRADSTQRSELREFQRHILWEVENDIADEFGAMHKPEPFSVTVLKTSIEHALVDPSATDWVGFVAAGRLHGVDIKQRGKKGYGISYGLLRQQPDGTVAEPSASDRRRCSTLGADFEMDAVEQAFERNRVTQQGPAVTVPAVEHVVRPGLPSAPPKLAQRTQSAKERLRTALDQANEEADANTQRMIADYLKAKASTAESQELKHSLEQVKKDAAEPVSDNLVLPHSHDSQHWRAQDALQTAPVPADEPETAGGMSKALTAETGPERSSRKFSGRNGHMDSLLESRVTPKATLAMEAAQRKRRLRFPELYADFEPATDPRESEHDLGG